MGHQQAHAADHENGGVDEIDVTGLTGAGGGAGAPTTVDYLVGTADAGLSAEIVVGTSPGGELGGTWAAPTVDATHSGSAHHAAATEGTGIDISGQAISVDLSELSAGGELAGTLDAPTVDATHSGSTHAAATDTHIADTSAAHAASAVSVDSATLVGTGTDVQAVFEEVDNDIAALKVPDYLVGTATGTLAGEIVAGTAPAGELGGTWASPTVDATHSGSTHAASTDTHIADTSTAHAAASVDAVAIGGGGTETVKAVGATGATETITLALSDGNVQTFTVDANCTFTMPSGLGAGAKSFTAVLTDSGGPRTITFTGVKWSGGNNPTVMSGASAVDIFSFMTLDGGTTWYGFIGGQAMAV